MPAVPPPILDYASRRRRRMSGEEWRTLAADCGVVVAAVVGAVVVGLATTFLLHELFGLCFGGR